MTVLISRTLERVGLQYVMLLGGLALAASAAVSLTGSQQAATARTVRESTARPGAAITLPSHQGFEVVFYLVASEAQEREAAALESASPGAPRSTRASLVLWAQSPAQELSAMQTVGEQSFVVADAGGFYHMVDLRHR